MEEMMREWMARQTEANERMKNQVVELERKINQGLRNRQAIIENLERQFKFLTRRINVPKHYLIPQIPNRDMELKMKKDIKKDDVGVPKELNKEWKLNEKAVPHNKEVYHYV
nr:hypothetical protein [Tanacetum cinerariifolium]